MIFYDLLTIKHTQLSIFNKNYFNKRKSNRIVYFPFVLLSINGVISNDVLSGLIMKLMNEII